MASSRTLGIVGGLGPETTIDYYKQIIALHAQRTADGNDPHILIDSINLKEMRDYAEAGRFDQMADGLVLSVERLARAGADFGVLGANTAHIVFDDVQKRSPIPLVSIVEATRDAARAKGLKRVGLMGTRFTMQAKMFPDVFGRDGIAVVAPAPEELEWIHEIYFGELVKGIFRDETRQRLLAFAAKLRERDRIDGLVLGGTEVALALRDSDAGIPMLDTATIHVEKIVEELLAD